MGRCWCRLPSPPPEPPPGIESEAKRIARETILAIRTSEQGTNTASLAPLTPAQQRRLAVAGPLAGGGRAASCPRVQPGARLGAARRHGAADGGVGQLHTPDFEAGRFQSYIFAPDTCAATRLPTPGDLFCAGHAGLPNGNVLIAGGTRQYDPFQGLRTSYEYNWVTRQFVRLPLMAGGGRWWPGQLGNGDVFVLSGLNGAGALNTQPEVYRHGSRTWSATPYRLSVPTYAHMLPTAGGRLFFTGVGFGGSAVRVGVPVAAERRVPGGGRTGHQPA